MYRIPITELQDRRSKLADKLPTSSVLVIFSAEVQTRNADVEYPFRQDSDFWYLTGINEEDGIYVMKIGEDGAQTEVLYGASFDPNKEQWTGKKLGREGSAHVSGISLVADFDQFEQDWKELFSGISTVYLDLGGQSYPQLRSKLGDYITNDARRGATERIQSVSRTTDLMGHLRMYKSEWEIDQMRTSAQIAVTAHRDMYQTLVDHIQSGKVYEYQLEAELLYLFRKNQAGWSYPPIVATGNNACTLHYTANDAQVQTQDLVLVDAGCEYGYYASDITRCYPASGRFTEAQRKVYTLVLKSQQAALVEAAKDGSSTGSIHQAAVQCITEGLVELGILSGSVDLLVQEQAYMPYYMHGTGHYLGLDVHDLGPYRTLDGTRSSVIFEPGMVITVEPGVYFKADDETVPVALRGIGVRIEDDVLKTASGIEILTEGIPKEIGALESLIL